MNAPPRAAPRCLVVDDSALVRRLVRDALAALPTSGVDEAADGREALACCAAHTYDLVWTDRDMPVLDGLGFVAQLRTLPGYAAVPVVMLSSDAPPAVPLQQLGLSAYLRKPVGAAEIVATASAWLKPSPGQW